MRFLLTAFVAVLPGLSNNVAFGAAKAGHGFDVVRYELLLNPNITNKAVVGVETITLRSTVSDLRQLIFSANALTIDSAALDGTIVKFSIVGGTLVFDLSKPLVHGRKARLKISYHGVPARGIVATGAAIYTSYFACDWMICLQDSPGDKALFMVDLRVPKGVQSISIGKLVGEQRLTDRTEIHRWRITRPYAAYLLSFAAGRFAHVVDPFEGPQLVYLSDVANEAELHRQFASTGAMVRFMSEKAGMELPTRQHTQLLVAGSEAQEAATYSTLGVDALPSNPADPAEDWAIAHELSHQWWGNLVTCATWRDFWLNEGMATFMTAAWKEYRYGRTAYDAEMDVARRRLAKAQDKGFDKPLVWEGDYPTLGARRAVQYSKGALFLDHLRTLLGEKAFWSGLQQYTRKHAGGTVTSIDFQRAMKKVSGRNLSDVFGEWVFVTAP